MINTDPVIMTGNAHPALARDVARLLNLNLANVYAGAHPDGEPNIQCIDDVRGRDVYILQPTSQPDRNLIELALLGMAIRPSAGRITMVIPYFGFARQDRRDKPRVPISVDLAIRILAGTGVNRIVLLDLHTPQIVGMFEAENPNISIDHMYCRSVILDWLAQQDLSNITFSSIDAGGAKWVESYYQRLRDMGFPVEFGIGAKSGSSTAGIAGVQLLGKYAGHRTVFLDDMVTTASSAVTGSHVALSLGATDVWMIAIHPVLANAEVCRRIIDSPIARFITTDTLPMKEEYRHILEPKLTVIPIAPLLALVVKHLHEDRSLSMFFELAGYRAGLQELGMG